MCVIITAWKTKVGASVARLGSLIRHAITKTSIVMSFLWSSLCLNESFVDDIAILRNFCALIAWNFSCDSHIRIEISAPASSELSNDQKQDEDEEVCECEGPGQFNGSLLLSQIKLKMPFPLWYAAAISLESSTVYSTKRNKSERKSFILNWVCCL